MSDQPPPADRLTGRVQRALAAARLEARALRLPAANLETLLVALTEDADSLAGRALEATPAVTARMRTLLAPDRLPDLAPDTQNALIEAVRLADRSDSPYVGAEHLLLAVLSPRAERAVGVQQFVSRAAHTDRAQVAARLAVLLADRGGVHDRRLLAVMELEQTPDDDGQGE